MESNRVISSLCYFSIFFAGFIFPIAVYFIVDSAEVKAHAKSALFSHLIPFITLPLFFVIIMMSFGDPFAIVLIVVFVLFGLINLAVFVWNVVKGIQVLRG